MKKNSGELKRNQRFLFNAMFRLRRNIEIFLEENFENFWRCRVATPERA